MTSVDRGPPQGGEAWGAEFKEAIKGANTARDRLRGLATADQDGAAGSDARVSSDNKVMAAKILSSLAPVTSLTAGQVKVDGVTKKTFEKMEYLLNIAAGTLENRVTKDPHSVGAFVADILVELKAIEGVSDLIESGTTQIPNEIIGRIGIEWVVVDFKEVMTSNSTGEELKQKLLEVVDKTHTMVMAEVRGRGGVGVESTKGGIRLQTFTSIRDFFVGIANYLGGKGAASKSAVVSEAQTKVNGFSGKIAVLQGKLRELESLSAELQNNKASLARLKESRRGLLGEGEEFSPKLTEVKLEKRQVEIKARLAVLTPKKDAITIELAEITALQKAGAWRTSEMQGDGLVHPERSSGAFDGVSANGREDVIGYGGETVSLSRMGASADHQAGFIQGEGKVESLEALVDVCVDEFENMQEQLEELDPIIKEFKARYETLKGEGKGTSGITELIEKHEKKYATAKGLSNKLNDARVKLSFHKGIQSAINAGINPLAIEGKKTHKPRKVKDVLADLYAGKLAADGTQIGRFSSKKAVASKKFAKNNMTLSCKSLRKDIEELQEVKAGLISAGASPMAESVKKIDSQISVLTEKLEARQEVCEAQSVSVISASIDSYMDSLSTDTAPHGQIFNKVGEGADTTYEIADQARYDKFLASPEGFAFASGQWMEADFVLVDPKNKKLELGMLEDQAETMTRLRAKLHISFDGAHDEKGKAGVSHQSGSWGIHMPKIKSKAGEEVGKEMSYGGMMVSFPLNSPKLAKDPTVLEINKREARVLVDQSVSYRMHLSGALDKQLVAYTSQGPSKGGSTEFKRFQSETKGMTLRAKIKWVEKDSHFKLALKDEGVSCIATAFNNDETRLKKAGKYLAFSMQEVSSREMTQQLENAMPDHMKAQLNGGGAKYNALRQAITDGDVKSIAAETMVHMGSLVTDDLQGKTFTALLSSMAGVGENTFDAEMSAVASPPKKRSTMTMDSTIDLGELAMGRGVKTRVRCKSAKDRTLILVAAFAARFVNMKKKKRDEKPINESMARARFMYQGLGLEVCSENVGRPGSKANLAAVGPALIYGQAFSALKAAYYGKKQST